MDTCRAEALLVKTEIASPCSFSFCSVFPDSGQCHPHDKLPTNETVSGGMGMPESSRKEVSSRHPRLSTGIVFHRIFCNL
mmetsp:Transcript_17686/g.58219  ORF Transcript_17686/g.58219 Transcript_17686/m.58219 type:complete len:80 (+) Transcript_17686:1510-1749(+)